MGSRDTEPSNERGGCRDRTHRKDAEGTVGVAAIHLETGRRVVFHADESFPMASTVKGVVFIKGSEARPGTRETVSADIARLVYDCFLISPP